MQVFAAHIASRLLPGFALGAINVEDVTSDEVRQYVVYCTVSNYTLPHPDSQNLAEPGPDFLACKI